MNRQSLIIDCDPGVDDAAALLLAWGGIAWWTTQHIASGTTVSGVDVSGLSPKEARDRVGKGIGDQLAQPVTLTVGQGSSELVPAKSGISVDTDASVKKLTGFTLNPLTLAQRLGGQHTDAVIRVDSTALRGALASLDAEIAAGHGEDDFSTILLPGAAQTEG